MKVKTRNRYSDDFKTRALELAGLGKPVSEVAKDLKISSDLIYRWKREMNGSAKPAEGGSEGLLAGGEQAVADELRRLRRENAHLQMENDILKKAAVILGTKTHPKGGK